MWWSWRRSSEKMIICILSLSTWRKTSTSSWRTGKKKGEKKETKVVCSSDVFATCKKLAVCYNFKMSASCQAPSAPSPPHLKPSHIRHGFSCLVIWIIRRDSTGFRCDILYFCHRAFKYVPMPSGYPLYAAAKRMNPRCWRALMFFLFWKPRKVCTVLGTHTTNWPL